MRDSWFQLISQCEEVQKHLRLHILTIYECNSYIFLVEKFFKSELSAAKIKRREEGREKYLH